MNTLPAQKYIPGVCNIGPAEIKSRMIAGGRPHPHRSCGRSPFLPPGLAADASRSLLSCIYFSHRVSPSSISFLRRLWRPGTLQCFERSREDRKRFSAGVPQEGPAESGSDLHLFGRDCCDHGACYSFHLVKAKSTRTGNCLYLWRQLLGF